MKFRIFILSLACLACLAPAQGSLHALKAAAAVGALAIKGAAIKGAIEGAAAKTAALLAAKGAVLKGALALASHAVHKLPVKPVIVEEPAVVVPSVVPANAVFVRTSPPCRPPVSNSLTSLLAAAHNAAQHKLAVSSAVVPAPVVVESFRHPYPPRDYPAPLTALHLIDNDFI